MTSQTTETHTLTHCTIAAWDKFIGHPLNVIGSKKDLTSDAKYRLDNQTKMNLRQILKSFMLRRTYESCIPIKNGDPITSVLLIEIISQMLKYNTDLERETVIQFMGTFKAFAAKYSDSQTLQNIWMQGQLLHAATGLINVNQPIPHPE